MNLESEVWAVVKSLKVDEFIASNTSRNSILRKVIPRSRAYAHEKYEFGITPKLKIVLDRSDYTQWRVFSGGLFINSNIFKFLNVNKDNFTMIDVGANIGAYTILMSTHVKSGNFNVHLFEPNPRIHGTLEENITRLELANPSINAYVNHYAVGDKETVLPLKLNETHTGLATLGHASEDVTETIDVKVIPLDQYAKEKNLQQLDFLKIDVECFEPSVFQGARETLANLKPLLYFEYGREWFENFDTAYIDDIASFLYSVGYQFYREGRDGQLHKISLIEKALKQYSHLNILGTCQTN
jgi:FkbM family methyltransferase